MRDWATKEQYHYIDSQVQGFEDTQGKKLARKLWYAEFYQRWEEKWTLDAIHKLKIPSYLRTQLQRRGTYRVTMPEMARYKPKTRLRTHKNKAKSGKAKKTVSRAHKDKAKSGGKTKSVPRAGTGSDRPQTSRAVNGSHRHTRSPLASTSRHQDSRSSVCAPVIQTMVQQAITQPENIDNGSQALHVEDGNDRGPIFVQAPTVYRTNSGSTLFLTVDMPGIHPSNVMLAFKGQQVSIHASNTSIARAYEWQCNFDVPIVMGRLRCGMQCGRLRIAVPIADEANGAEDEAQAKQLVSISNNWPWS
ncbi:hypothetical protein EYR36_009016 [Pleurotus pulmonarius]|nr:hypothetical protein EYR36_009016 [Pleurotus pulmonarius]